MASKSQTQKIHVSVTMVGSMQRSILFQEKFCLLQIRAQIIPVEHRATKMRPTVIFSMHHMRISHTLAHGAPFYRQYGSGRTAVHFRLILNAWTVAASPAASPAASQRRVRKITVSIANLPWWSNSHLEFLKGAPRFKPTNLLAKTWNLANLNLT